MVSRIILTGLSVIFLGTIAYPQADGNSFSLKEAQEYATKNNALVKNASLDVEKSKKKIKETTAIGLPRIYSNVDYSNFIDIPTQVIPASAFSPGAPSDLLVPVQFGTTQSLSAGLTLNQLVFDGTYIVGLQASKVYLQSSNDALIKTQADVKDAVTKAYYMVLVARENTKILKGTLGNFETSLKETEAMYKEGMIEESNVDQLKLGLTNIKNSIEKATQQSDVALQMLKFQLGLSLTQELILKDSLSSLISLVEESTIEPGKFSPNNHIDFKILETQENLAALNLKKEKFSRLPSIGAFFTHSQNAFGNSFSFFDSDQPYYPTSIWGVKVTIPIFDSFGTSSKIKQADMDLQKIRNIKAMTSESLQLQLQTAQTEYNSTLKSYKLEKDNLELAKKLLDQTMIKYKEGLNSSFELTQMQNQYLTTQGQYINAMFQLLTAKQNLDKAMSN